MKTLSLVVPVFNEEETLPFTHERFVSLLKAPALTGRLKIVYVDDGSRDRSPMILDRLALAATGGRQVRVVHFARNFGHSAAVTAGLAECTGEHDRHPGRGSAGSAGADSGHGCIDRAGVGRGLRPADCAPRRDPAQAM